MDIFLQESLSGISRRNSERGNKFLTKFACSESDKRFSLEFYEKMKSLELIDLGIKAVSTRVIDEYALLDAGANQGVWCWSSTIVFTDWRQINVCKSLGRAEIQSKKSSACGRHRRHPPVKNDESIFSARPLATVLSSSKWGKWLRDLKFGLYNLH